MLRIPETQAKDVTLGQPAAIDTRNGIVARQVLRIDPAVQNGTVTVDVLLEGELPRGARPDLSVDGTIQVERLDNVLHVGRPAFGQAGSTVGLFKLTPDGTEAVRTTVRLGRASVNSVEVQGGLQPGDKVIISDMSRWDGFGPGAGRVGRSRGSALGGRPRRTNRRDHAGRPPAGRRQSST